VSTETPEVFSINTQFLGEKKRKKTFPSGGHQYGCFPTTWQHHGWLCFEAAVATDGAGSPDGSGVEKGGPEGWCRGGSARTGECPTPLRTPPLPAAFPDEAYGVFTQQIGNWIFNIGHFSISWANS